jgi:thiol-disulfide isomerase/thioredoxin
MTSRLLAMFGLVALMVGLASAQETKQEVKEKASIKDQVKEALKVSGEGDLPKAISILEEGLKSAPDDRNALFLLGAMTVVEGDKTEQKADRLEMYRKSTRAFAKLQSLFKDLAANEKRFLLMSRLGEARVLASEKKVDQAFAVIKKANAEGFEDFDSLEADKDLEPICQLPAFQELVESIYKPKLEEAKKEVAEELANFKSFPFDFKLKDTDDKPVSLADSKGKVTIVDVWGTWCPPCRMEIPHFVALYRKLHEKGLEIVGINTEQVAPDQVKQTIKDFAKETKIPYKCVVNDGKTEEKIPGFQGYPTTLFVDRAGKVRMMLVGYTPKAKLEAIVTTLLADSSTPDAAKAK